MVSFWVVQYLAAANAFLLQGGTIMNSARLSPNFHARRHPEMLVAAGFDGKAVLRGVTEDHVPLAVRHALYEARKRAVDEHNSRPSSWRAVLNRFSVATEAERRSSLGHLRLDKHESRKHNTLSLFSSKMPSKHILPSTALQQDLFNEVDWRRKLHSASFVRFQGSCGSCWAVAATGALEMHLELATGEATELSYEHLVDCVPNPLMCGGQGGCDGATAELAYGYVQEHGISLSSAYPDERKCRPDVAELITIAGFVQLPANRADPLLHVLSTVGPATVTVYANDGWFHYGSGVFDGCPEDAVLNHGVLLVGYGLDAQLRKPYWLIRNSWGSAWGEDGHIRLLRHEGDSEYCGIDRDPRQGSGCIDSPSEVPVCGMCGVLTEASYPQGVQLKQKLNFAR